ncbi:MAG: acetyl-CoA C-acyltransferase [Caldimonas sp.]
MTEIVIVAAARTAVGKFGGALAKTPATELGATVISALLERARLKPEQIGEVILGQVLQAGCGQNPARQAAIKAGLPNSIPAMTINKVCGSGLKAVVLAAQAIRDGDSEIIIAGGQESMSMAPHVLPHSREGQRMGDWKLVDSMIVDGLWDVYNQYHMGITAENVAKKCAVSREAQDALALASQQKAAAAQEGGRFKDEIVPFSIAQKKGDPIVFAADEFINRKTSAEALAGLRPAFDKAGSVTAGNASGLNDGAAAVVVMTAKRADQLGLKPLARIASYATVALDPSIMGMGPVPASQKALQRADWDAVIETNLTSLFNVTKQVIEGMVEHGWGRIINISSVNGEKGQFGQTNYSAAKAGMHGFTMALAQEVASKGVTVNTVSPGYIATDMVRAIRREVLDKIVANIPVNRLGTPQDIASMVSWVASEESGFATGADFSVNGGLHMG